MKPIFDYEALVVGAGPVGLSLALGLARNSRRVLVIDEKHQLDPHSRATIIHSRTLEIFEQWGILERFLSRGERVPLVRLELPNSRKTIVQLDFTELIDETAAAFAIALSQDQTERILLDAVAETGLVDVRFSTEFTAFDERDELVRVSARRGGDESAVTVQYLVGADGAHSRIRGQLGLDLHGKTYPTRALLADVRVEPSRDRVGVWPTLLSHAGFVTAIRFGSGVWRIIEQSVDDSVTERTIDGHVASLATELFGVAPLEVVWRNTFHKHERSVGTFRAKRVLLAGDAAHLNSPAGGQGMNSGIQDAHNLAWKLATSIGNEGADVGALLDSYSQERASLVAHDIQPFTDIAERFQTAPPFAREAIVGVADVLFGFSKSASAMTRRLSMLDVRYGRSSLLRGTPPTGHRLPDVFDDDGTRIYAKIRDGAIVWSGDDSAGEQVCGALHMPAFRYELASLRKFFRTDRFVALIRPDQIVGFVTRPADAFEALHEFSKSVGRPAPMSHCARTF